MSDIQSINNAHFNKTAQDYDSFPQAKELTERAAETIVQEFIASAGPERAKNAIALDFGCGTGLCAFKVAPHVKEIVGVDASEGMTQHLNHKLTTQDENKAIRDSIKTVTHLVTQNEPLPEPERSQYLAGANGGFDLIYSSYVMHHIEDIQGTIDTLAQKLVKKDGWVIIIDFQGPHHHHHHHHEGDGEHEKHGEHSSEGHGHGHGHNHNHGHSHGDISNSLFVDENGNPLDYVAHKQGFTSEGLTEVFKKAGLVDVSARTAFGMSRELFGKKIWADVLVIKGRRA